MVKIKLSCYIEEIKGNFDRVIFTEKNGKPFFKIKNEHVDPETLKQTEFRETTKALFNSFKDLPEAYIEAYKEGGNSIDITAWNDFTKRNSKAVKNKTAFFGPRMPSEATKEDFDFPEVGYTTQGVLPGEIKIGWDDPGAPYKGKPALLIWDTQENTIKAILEDFTTWDNEQVIISNCVPGRKYLISLIATNTENDWRINTMATSEISAGESESISLEDLTDVTGVDYTDGDLLIAQGDSYTSEIYKMVTATSGNLPELKIGQPGFETDTGNLYVGSDSGNIKIGATGGGDVTTEEFNRIQDRLATIALETMANGDITRKEFIDGLIDSYQDESGIDEGASVGQTYFPSLQAYSGINAITDLDETQTEWGEGSLTNVLATTADQLTLAQIGTTLISDGSTLSGWTNSGGCSVDPGEGNPAPSIDVPGNDYAYKDVNMKPGDTLEADIKQEGGTPIANLYFLCNSSGEGNMIQLDDRDFEYSGPASTSSWTNWGSPGWMFGISTGFNHLKIETDDTKAYIYVDGSFWDSWAFTNKGGYIAMHGDSGSGGKFDNIKITKTDYESSGNRESPQLDCSPAKAYQGSIVSIDKTVNTGQTVKVETRVSLDGGGTWTSWQEVTDGNEIPDLSLGDDLSNALLESKQTLTTTDQTTTPSLNSLKINLYGVGNMTLVSNPVTVETEPTKARLMGMINKKETITLNTDLKAYVSKDGGATFDQVTLEKRSDYNGRIIVSATTTLSSSGKSLKYKWVTSNKINLKINGTVCLGD